MALAAASAQPRRVLVHHIGSLGDTLMALPALWALRQAWPSASLTLLTKRTQLAHVVVAHSLLSGSGLFDDHLEYQGRREGGDGWVQRAKQVALLLRLRVRRFDAVVTLAPSERQAAQVARDARFFAWAGIRRRIGFDVSWEPPSRAQRPLPTLPSEAEALLERLRRAGLPVPPLDQARRDCGLNERDFAAAEAWIETQAAAARSRPWLALAPGSNMPSKIWPEERFAELARVLVHEHGLWPVVFGGPEDQDTGDRLVRALGQGSNAAGALSPRAAAAALRRAALFVGNDTGTMHLAASEGVPCVAAFSARDFPGKWHPIGGAHVVLRRRLPCEGCMLERCEAQRMACLLDIGVQEVLNAARQLLEAGKAARCGQSRRALA